MTTILIASIAILSIDMGRAGYTNGLPAICSDIRNKALISSIARVFSI